MRVLAAVGAFVALGLFCACGGDSGEAGSTLSGGVDIIGVSQCLSDAGFLLQPSSEAIGGKTPGGTEFEISFYENAEAAKAAQASMDSETAAVVENAVIESSGTGGVSDEDTGTVQRCIDENG